MYANELRTQLGVIANQIRTIVDTAKEQGNRGLTSEEATKFDALEADYTRIDASIERAEKADKFSAANVTTLNADTMEQFQASSKGHGSDKHAKAFTGYLRGGMEALASDERSLMASKRVQFNNAQSTTTAGSGGYLVPQGFSQQLESALKFYGGILGNVDSFTTESGNAFPWPTENDTNNVGRIIGQNVQATTTDLAFGQATFGAYIFSSDSVLVPLALIQDSYFDIDGFVAKKLGARIGRLLNTKLTVGLGSGSGEPNGLVTAAVAAGLVYTEAVGNTTAISFDDITELEHKVDPAYRYLPSSKFMFHDLTLKSLKKLKDSMNRPLWMPADSANGGGNIAQPTINGHAYVINNDMATMAANAYSVVFGDLSSYKVRRVQGEDVTVLRLVERYADFLQVGYIGFLRADGNLVDAGTHPVAVLRNSAT